MITRRPGKKLVIYVSSTERWEGQPLYSAIVERCFKHNIAGASVMNCVAGYGSHHVMHTTRLFSLSENLPVRVEIIETVDRFDQVYDVLKGMLSKGTAVVYDVEILKEE